MTLNTGLSSVPDEENVLFLRIIQNFGYNHWSMFLHPLMKINNIHIYEKMMMIKSSRDREKKVMKIEID
jgi:hypothetical protein